MEYGLREVELFGEKSAFETRALAGLECAM